MAAIGEPYALAARLRQAAEQGVSHGKLFFFFSQSTLLWFGMRNVLPGIAILVIGTLAAVHAWSADHKSIQGKVTGANGKGYGGAEIRVERLDAKAKPIFVTADKKGVYVLSGLPVGTYQVTAYVDGTARSRVKVHTSNAGWTKVDFDLRLNEQRGDGVDRMQTDLSLHTPSPGL